MLTIINVKDFDVNKVTFGDEQSFNNMYPDNFNRWVDIFYDNQPFILESDALYVPDEIIDGTISLKCPKSNDTIKVIRELENKIKTSYDNGLYYVKTNKHIVGNEKVGYKINPFVKRIRNDGNLYEIQLRDKNNNVIGNMHTITKAEVKAYFNMSKIIIAANHRMSNPVQLIKVQVLNPNFDIAYKFLDD